jgi:integrase
MATTKVGIYRSYYGPAPLDQTGQPLPKNKWVNTRLFSWVVRWFGSDGKRYSKSFETRKEAERFAESKQPDVRRGHGDLPQRCTLQQFYREHVQLSKGSVARKTLLQQLSTMRELATIIGWYRDLGRIESRDIETFRAARSEAVASAATVNKDVRTLRRLFNLASKRGYLTHGQNPCTGVGLLEVGETRPRFMSPAKFESVFAAATRLVDQAMLILLYTTGIRRGEMSHLTWDDIDFEQLILHVARHKADDYVQKWTPKDHERREIPLPEKAVELLHLWKEQSPKDCPYVFMDAERWQYYRDCVDRGVWNENQELVNNLLRKFITMTKRAKIGRFTLHDLRRSCITNWVRRGRPIHVVQALAGHADIETTRRYYLSVQEEDLAAARAAQQEIVRDLEPTGATDQLLTNSGPKRQFPKRKIFRDGTQLPHETEVT